MKHREEPALAQGGPPDEGKKKPLDDEHAPTPVVPLSASRVDADTDQLAKLISLSHRRHIAGEVLAGRYRIVRELGGGGMGQVFLAENLSIRQKVAIKVLRPELLANDAFRKRFQKEAEAIAAVEHQNVVRFFDLVVGDPTFLVMELVDGPTLASVIEREQRLVPLRAAELARRLCWGLDAAHRAGVIHRDIKPSNIIVAKDAECGEQPKLIDFGVAKTLTGPVDIQLTRHGQLVGTPHYMCPEQITGATTGAGVDERSDIYSLGCVLYHMVAGRPPFPGADEYLVLQQHLEKPPQPLDELIPDAPPELDHLLQRALAKEPSVRFASMRDMAHALAEVVRPTPSTIAPPPTEATGSMHRRPRAPVSTMVMIILGAAALGAAGAWFALHRSSAMTSGLLVASDPPGATVEIDGRALGETTPTVVRGVSAGKHRVRVHKAGRDAVEQVAVLDKDERTLIEVALPPASHFVALTSLPAGASVYLDGHRVGGVTPIRVAVTDDDFHELRFEQLGYAPALRRITPDDQAGELGVTLVPEDQPRGYLRVESSRASPVWIDGADTSLLAPTSSILVPVGEHLVELRENGSVRATARVSVRQGETAHVSFDPER